MNLYELTYVLRSDLDEDALTAVQGRVSGRLSDAKGDVLKSEAWGRRRLAYPIDRVREGFYFTSILRMSGEQVRGFENQLKLVPELLRFLLIRQEEANIDLSGSLLPASHRAPVTAPAPAAESGAESVPPVAVEEKTPAREAESAAEPVPPATGDGATPAPGISPPDEVAGTTPVDVAPSDESQVEAAEIAEGVASLTQPETTAETLPEPAQAEPEAQTTTAQDSGPSSDIGAAETAGASTAVEIGPPEPRESEVAGAEGEDPDTSGADGTASSGVEGASGAKETPTATVETRAKRKAKRKEE